MSLIVKKYLPIRLLIVLIFTSQVWPSALIEDCPSRTSLAQKIITLTQAERDIRLEAHYQLSQVLASPLITNNELKGRWNHLWTILKEPELLINKVPYLKFCDSPETAAFPQDSIFKYLFLTDNTINSFQSYLQGNQLLTHQIQSKLGEIKDYYQGFINKCKSKPHSYIEAYELLEPKAVLMGDLWPGKFYRLSQEMARHLLQFDEHGHIIVNNNQEVSTSNHRISFLPSQEGRSREVYFKANGMPALNPGREYMLSSLYQKLDIQVPATGLLILDHVKMGENYGEDVFVLQASQAIQGLSGKSVLQEKMVLNIDPEHYSRQVIGSLLTSPVDGKADDYIVTPLSNISHGWVSIDNDEVYQPPIRRDNSIHLKSALFLLPQMDQPLSESTAKHLLTLVPDMILLEWMTELQAQEQRYLLLKQALTFQGSKLKGVALSSHYMNELWDQLSLPFTSFNSSILPTLRDLLTVLQTSLKTNEHPTLQELFATCYPTIGATYHALRQKHPHDPHAALRDLYGNEGMVKRAAPLNDDDFEKNYFKEGLKNLEVLDLTQNTLSIHKNKLITFIQGTYGSQFVDAVMESYRTRVHASLPFITQTLRSFKVLQSEGFKYFENFELAFSLYLKGLLEAKVSGVESEWKNAFNTLALANKNLKRLLLVNEEEQKNIEASPFSYFFITHTFLPHELREILFSYFTEEHLAKLEQVSPSWNQRIQEYFGDKNIRILRRRILSLVENIDPYHFIQQQLRTQLWNLDPKQQTIIEKLIDEYILPPEKKLSDGIKSTHKLDFIKTPSPQHPLFAPLYDHINQLNSYRGLLQSIGLEKYLDQLINQYKIFIKNTVKQAQDLGIHTPIHYFETKPFLQGEGIVPHQLSANQAFKIVSHDLLGNLQRQNIEGSNPVSKLGGVYFKVDHGNTKLNPAWEFATYSFFKKVFGSGIAPSLLLSINDLTMILSHEQDARIKQILKEKREESGCSTNEELFRRKPELEIYSTASLSDASFMIQASLSVNGKRFDNFLKEVEKGATSYNALNQESFSNHILASLLLNPTDYKPDNLMINPQGEIIGIDNDHVLEGMELKRIIGKGHVPHVSNILYCLPLMEKTIDSSARKKFLKHMPAITLLKWLKGLESQDKAYENLFKKQFSSRYAANKREELHLPLKFTPGVISSMYKQWIDMQRLLQEENITHNALFKATQPLAYRYYQGLKQLSPNPIEQIRILYNTKQNTYGSNPTKEIFLEEMLRSSMQNNYQAFIEKIKEDMQEDMQYMHLLEVFDNHSIEKKKVQRKFLNSHSFKEQPASPSIQDAIQELITSIDLSIFPSSQKVQLISYLLESNILPVSYHPSWKNPALIQELRYQGAKNSILEFLSILASKGNNN